MKPEFLMKINKRVNFEELFPIIEETIKSGNQFTFCAFGISMLPFIRNGKDIVTLGPIKSELKKNDIIFYRRANGQFVLHRIINKASDESFDLCGDNQYYIEKGICTKQIIAKLDCLERNGKQIDLSSFKVRLWCFLLPLRRFLLHVKSAIRWRLRKLFKK